ncbi:MAG: thiamine pyrophosphate-binding protein [Chloroflexi bacterium]|nr:thiamine pyrophosphate-binding protein [Chloroflexota bacterium]
MATQRLTGGEIVMERLISEGIPYLIGIPGHGILGLMDAARERADKIQVIQVRHEQSAIHMADGYYRVRGRPLACFTSIGPGALNCAVGLGASYVDSTAVLLLSGEAHTYMAGRGVLQEIERQRPADLPRVLEPITKKTYRPQSPQSLNDALDEAFIEMKTGRPGPVFISMPMDVQADAADVTVTRSSSEAPNPPAPEPYAVAAAASLLKAARRPVIVAGGGVTLANAERELLRLAEQTGAAVVTTLQSKGCFPEDHPLYCWLLGSKGTSVGNAVTTTADVILAVGCRFTDQTASSYRKGATFNFPETKLIQIDIDPAEIGKNYPPDVSVLGDAAKSLAAISRRLPKKVNWESGEYFRDIQSYRRAWLQEVATLRDSGMSPSTVPRFYRELRNALDRDAIVVTSSGHAQACVIEFPFYEPRTNLTSGGFSCMGFAFPAALGARLAEPFKQIVAVVGDGDFMMTMQEMATAMQYGIDVVVVVLNNRGWYSIRDLQKGAFGEDRDFATVFNDAGTPDFYAAARAFGWHADRVDEPDGIEKALERAFGAGGPALIEVAVQQEFPYSGSNVVGWWDVPVPEYLEVRRAAYVTEREEVQAPPKRTR